MKTIASLGYCDVRLSNGVTVWGMVEEIELCGDLCLRVSNPHTGDRTFQKTEWREIVSLSQSQASLRTLKPHSLEAIKREVSAHFEVPFELLDSKRKFDHIVWPRHVAFFLAYATGDYCCEMIGLKFGGKNHGTVSHGITTVKNRMATEPEVLKTVNDLAEQLKIKIPERMKI